MQVAQFLERYRLTSDFAIQSLAGELLPQPPAHTDAGAPAQPQRPASTLPRKTPAAGSRGAGSKSAGSSSSSLHSSSDSEEDLSLNQLREKLQGPLDAFDQSPQQHRVRSSAQQTSAAQRGSAAYSVHHHEVIDTAKGALGWDLTADQERVLEEVMADMQGSRAMLRLLQGDVGCGKVGARLPSFLLGPVGTGLG
jgi:RecG-like helicase